MNKLEKFDLPTVEVTTEEIDYFKNTYGLDLYACSAQTIQILINFHKFGASQSIMNLIKINQQAQGTLEA